jgi:hypothetical protein
VKSNISDGSATGHEDARHRKLWPGTSHVCPGNGSTWALAAGAAKATIRRARSTIRI